MAASRLVAVLFADLVSSTETVARLGPEAGEAWRQRFLTAMREALAASGGREVQHTGDGLFAAFESASDAVSCAVGVQQRVARASERRDSGSPARARAGIAVGEAREDEEGVHGLVVVEAARLCAAAKPDQILTNALVETLAAGGPQRFVPAGELAIKGLPAPVAAREVIWETSAASHPLPPGLDEFKRGAFVGRGGERARLDAALEAARAGQRHLALVAGEPGIGKTRLAAEVACDAHAAGTIVLAGRCDEDLGSSFRPWVQALAHFAVHARAEELRTLLDEDTLPVARLLPELRRRLPNLPQPAEVDPQSERWRLFEAIDLLLVAASRAAPVLILIDDLHWADTPSLALLRHLARSTRPAALLLVGTYRETELARTHPLAELLADLRREPRVERVLLRGLAEPELGRLVAAHTEHEVPDGLVRMLHNETEGNPFFAGEVLRHLIEAGVLRREDGGWTAERPLAELGIPEGVREVVGRRLARLSKTTNQALHAAAVIGREFEATLLEGASGIARDELLDALDEASRAQIVAPLAGGFGRFTFAHALMQQTLYAELESAARMRLHWRIGEALERRHARELEVHASLIAHHFAEGLLAGDPVRSVDASLRAGERAATLAGHEETRTHLERALATLDQASLDEPERRYRAWMGIGQARMCLAETGHHEPFLQACRIAESQQWTDRMAEAAFYATWQLDSRDPLLRRRLLAVVESALAGLGDAVSPQRAGLLGHRAFLANFADCEYDRMEADTKEAVEVADRCGDPVVALRVRHPSIILLDGTPDIDEYERRSKEYLESAGDMRYGTPAVGFAAMGYVAAAFARGDRAELELRLTEFERRTERTGARTGLRDLGLWRLSLLIAEGRIKDAKRSIDEARSSWSGDAGRMLLLLAQESLVSVEQGRYAETAYALATLLATAPRLLQYSRPGLATALAELGRADEARRELETFDALALPRRGIGWPAALRQLAESAALLGDQDRAAALLPMLDPFAGRLLVAYRGDVIQCSADRARGQVRATLGRLDEAVACYESGLALEESFGARALAARTRYWLARALAGRAAGSDLARSAAEAVASRDAARAFGMEHLARQADSLAASVA